VSTSSAVPVEGLLLSLGYEEGGSRYRLRAEIEAAIIETTRRLAGAAAAKTLEAKGIEALHEVLEAEMIGPLRDGVVENFRPQLLSMAVSIGRNVLNWKGDFFVDDYLILRINFPYDVARGFGVAVENPGIGRVSPSVRDLAKSRRVIDPVYKPRDYHQGHSPAAWAHGPHVDSWAGHSRNGVNLWWAISDVAEDAGMVIYPELGRGPFPRDPRTQYLAAGYSLPKPRTLPLRAGELLIFDPELLHGTRLNTTQRTRVAVSMRLNSAAPRFDPKCFYAREFWRRASDIEQGRDEVIHLRREANLAEIIVTNDPPTRREHGTPEIVLEPHGKLPLVIEARRAPEEGGRLKIRAGKILLILARYQERLVAFEAQCPHYGLDLGDGALEGKNTYCPGCAVAFDIETGESGTPSLRLRHWSVGEEADSIILAPNTPFPS
jgi:nitrite reductase/ring-hydroxylating ferredoxin subunit